MIKFTVGIATLGLGGVLMLSACGGTKAPGPVAVGGTPASPVAASSAPARDASAVVQALMASGTLPMSAPVVQTETTDPNNMLGRPGQYTSRASFDVQGADPDAHTGSIDRGGVVEVWPDSASVTARIKALTALLKGGGGAFGAEYDYPRGNVLVRISGKVPPSVAQKFGDALANLD